MRNGDPVAAEAGLVRLCCTRERVVRARWRGPREGAAPGGGTSPTPLYSRGLACKENSKPGLILRTDGQQSVSRGGAPCPAPFLHVEDPLGAPRLPLIFLQNLSFALARDPARHEDSPTPGKTPRPRYRRPPRRTRKNGAGPRDPAGNGDPGATGWRSCEGAAGTGTRKAAAWARRAIQVTTQPFVKHHLSCSRLSSVPFSA